MKRFLASVLLCGLILFLGLLFFLPSAGAQNSATRDSSSRPEVILNGLLSLPAPPPPNPFYRPVSTDRDENFFDKKTPPPENAPIQDLLDYWKKQAEYDAKYTYTATPNEKTVERLMSEVEKKPELLAELVDVFPETQDAAEFVKRFYDEESSSRKFEQSWRTAVKKWLTYHSNYYSDELYQTANQAADTREYVTNQDEVLALSRVDWDKAKPILDRMLANSQQPVSQTLARWAYYQHALKVNDSLDIESFRKQLQETVENKSLGAGNRDLAMDALVESGDYPGRDDWYYSLLEDETLYDLRVNGQTYTGLTTILNHSPDDKYVAKMIELVGSGSPAVRNAAVKNLGTLLNAEVKNPEIIRALLPWLENPKWATGDGGERAKILMALRTYAMPESVPGIIAMLNEKERQTVETTATVNANRAISNVAPRTQTVDSYPYRSYAIAALEKQRSPLAAAPLRQILASVETYERQGVVRAILASNGFSVTEQIEALEEVAKNMKNPIVVSDGANVSSPVLSNTVVTTETEELRAPPLTMSNMVKAPRYDPNDLRFILGNQLLTVEDPGEALVKAVIDRIGFYEKKDPQIAEALRSILQNWKGAAINSLFLSDLKNGKSNFVAITKLLVLRKELREKQSNEVMDIRGGNPTALGISACLIEQPNEYDAILDGGNDEAKASMLSCARLIRAVLPVEKVAANLKSGNKYLATAAEYYLESEDSPEARQIVLALHPNEAKILGARTAFLPDASQAAGFYMPFVRDLFVSVDNGYEKFPAYYFTNTTIDAEAEKKLQREIREQADLYGIYAYDSNFVRIYKDRVVFSWEDDPARYRERNLSGEEFEALKNFLASQRVDELPPFLSACPGCDGKELLMLGKAGGRRIFVKAAPMPQFFTELETMFAEFRKQPAAIHYYLEKDVSGLEILFASDEYGAETLWKDGEDFRLLVDDLTLRKQNEKAAEESSDRLVVDEESEETEETEEETAETKAAAEKERKQEEMIERQRQYGSYSWYKFDKSKLVEPIAQPPGVDFIPPVDGFAVQPGDQQWKARTATVEIRADSEGLYKISRGQFSKIRTGTYYKPFVTPNGRWAIVTKYADEDEYTGKTYRINLLTNREFVIKLSEDGGGAEGVAFLPALNKVLLFSSYGEGEDGGYEADQRDGEYFLLDPDTGAVQPLGDQARVLLQQTFRPLQTVSGVPDALWAVLPDRENNTTQFGIFSTRTLTFKNLLTIPKIVFDSMDTWVDEREGKFYFVYKSQLLALPLPKNR